MVTTLTPEHNPYRPPVINGTYKLTLYPNGEFVAGRLGLSNPANYRNDPDRKQDEKPERLPRGSSGITGKQKRKIRNGCYVLQKLWGRSQLAFLTVTFPALSLADLKKVVTHYGSVSRIFARFCEELQRELARKNAVTDYCYCIEIQEKRWLKYGFPGYHLHLLFVSKDKTGRYVLTPNQIRAIWERILFNALDYRPDVNAAIDLQRLKKDPARYLSKYMSKGSKVLTEIQSQIGQDFIPNAWAGTSKRVRSIIDTGISENQQLVTKYKQGTLLDEASWLFSIIKSIDGQETVIGFCGLMKSERYKLSRDILYELYSLCTV